MFFVLTQHSHAPSAALIPRGAVSFGGSGFAEVVFIFETICFAGAGAGPEAGDAVVGAGGEDVPDGMPVDGPDGEFVGVLNFVGGVDGLSRGGGGVGAVVGGDGRGLGGGRVGLVEEVVVDAAVYAACGEEGGVEGVPG